MYQRIYEKYFGISRRRMMEWLQSQESYQLMKPAPKPTTSHHNIIATELDERWMMDLTDWTSKPDGSSNGF